MRVKKVLFFLVIFIGFSGQAMAETWYEVKSENFVLYSDNMEEASKNLVKDLEYFRHFLQAFTNVKNTEATYPLEIFAYKGRKDFRKEIGVSERVGGFFFTHFKGTTAFAMTPRGSNSNTGGRQILFHEYVHFFMSQFSRFHYPIWYREGFADYLSAFTFVNGRITIGQVLPDRVFSLNSENWYNLKTIFKSISNWATDKEWDDVSGILYAQSWITVHYLNGNPDYQRQLFNYLIEIDKGVNFEEAFNKTFSISLEDLDEEISDFWWKHQIPYKFYKLSDVEFQPDIKVRKLGKEEAAYIKAKARSYRVKNKEGFEDFEKYTKGVLKVFPEAFKIKLLFAEQMSLWGGEDRKTEASELILKIAEANPEDSDSLTIAGRVSFYKFFEIEDETAKAKILGTARTFLKAAIKINPENVYAHYYLGYSYIYQTDKKPGRGFKALIQAINLVPQQNLFQFDLGLLQARYGYLEEARETFEYYLEFGYRQNYRNAALFCLDEIDLAGKDHQCLFSDYRELQSFDIEEPTEEDDD